MYLLNCDILYVFFILNKFQIVIFYCMFVEIVNIVLIMFINKIYVIYKYLYFNELKDIIILECWILINVL